MNEIGRQSSMTIAASKPKARQGAMFALALAVLTSIFTPAVLVHAESSIGRIIVTGDEWALSDAGLSANSTYVTNVLKWFALTPDGSGKKVMILDGQSWNSGFGGTSGAFGSALRSLLTGNGVSVTYRDYTSEPVSLGGYAAVFVDGLMVNDPTLTNDLANFVVGGGAVYLAGGTGTIGNGAAGEAAYWQPFFNAATGVTDFGLGSNGWLESQGALNVSGPVGEAVTGLSWYMGQGVRVGNSPNASAAIWDSATTLVATWLASSPLEFTDIQRLADGSIQLIAMGQTMPIRLTHRPTTGSVR